MKTKLLAAFAAASVLALTGCSGGDEVATSRSACSRSRTSRSTPSRIRRFPRHLPCREHRGQPLARRSVRQLRLLPPDGRNHARDDRHDRPHEVGRSGLHEVEEHSAQDDEDPPHLRRRDADAPLHLLLHQGDDGQLQAQPLDDPALGHRRLGKPPAVPAKTI